MNRVSNLFLEDFFLDTDQTEVVTYVADLGLYFILRVSGLSYSCTVLGSELSLIQWRFSGGKLVVEDKKGVFQISKVNEDDTGLLVNVTRGENKKVVYQKKCYLNVLHGVDSVDIEEFGSVMDGKNEKLYRKIMSLVLNKDTAKQIAVPLIVLAIGVFMLFRT